MPRATPARAAQPLISSSQEIDGPFADAPRRDFRSVYVIRETAATRRPDLILFISIHREHIRTLRGVYEEMMERDRASRARVPERERPRRNLVEHRQTALSKHRSYSATRFPTEHYFISTARAAFRGQPCSDLSSIKQRLRVSTSNFIRHRSDGLPLSSCPFAAERALRSESPGNFETSVDSMRNNLAVVISNCFTELARVPRIHRSACVFALRAGTV